jgi:hypothetical protein
MQPALARDGAVVCERVLSQEAIGLIRAHFDAVRGERAGVRAFEVPAAIADLISPAGPLGTLAAQAAGATARPVRVLLFDKTPAANWTLPWHQDRTIAVKARVDVDGFGPWTRKSGVVHVEPPVDILQAMVTLRVFVDDCAADNGPLEIILGSHRHGRLLERDMDDTIRRGPVFAALGRVGDVLLMKSLALHSSKRAAVPGHRRVLHVDYATVDLPAPLAWRMS